MSNATQAVTTRFAAEHADHRRADWRAAVRRHWQSVIDGWKAWQQARADRRLDRWYAGRRDAHERFLARAHDHYELEHLERAWERNPEWWR